MITRAQAEAFDRDGFVLVDDLFSPREVAVLLANAQDGVRVRGKVGDMPDSAGRSSKLALWMDIGTDAFSAVISSPRVVDSMRVLLRDDVYHWHSKVMIKEPRVGGAWEWHQDYGYWYHDGCPYPRLASCLIALDGATRENGCLKVLVGSHRLGRIEHGQVGNQSGADRARVEELERLLPVRYVEAKPGTALFFDSNTLHSSEANLSERARTSFICCYNAMSNAPFAGKGHGTPTPIVPVAEDAILRFEEAVAH